MIVPEDRITRGVPIGGLQALALVKGSLVKRLSRSRPGFRGVLPKIMSQKIEQWICQEMGKLGIDASEDLAQYILSINTADDLEEYIHELLDGTDTRTQKFIKELLIRYRTYKSASSDNIQIYRKSDIDETYVLGKDSKSSKQREKKVPPTKTYINGYGIENRGLLPGEERSQSDQRNNLQAPVVKERVEKKKQKYVPLFSKEGQEKAVIQLSGRHTCECQAAKHKLVNNCTRCGRVVCEQEGSGPCLFCGNLVCTEEENEILSRNSKKSEKLRQHLMKGRPDHLLGQHLFNDGDTRDPLPHASNLMKEGYQKAEQHKDKLLEYDKTSAKRTQVIDDESDYFSTDSKWLSRQDRDLLGQREEELRSQRHTSRKDRKITLDFAGRRVIEEESTAGKEMYNVNDDVIQQVHYGARPKVKGGGADTGVKVITSADTYLVNPNIPAEPPRFVSQMHQKLSKPVKEAVCDPSKTVRRIQDRELLEMTDEGLCMSMHQPYASLLTSGVKKHEGRSWYTSHRGRLWIAATAKAPEPAEVADVEQMYRYLYKNPNLEFPSHYPVGCLLGCVEVTDCLPQDAYREKYPDGESASPYVFICTSPQELLVKFPIKGKHKIYKLDSHIHQAAKKGLR